MRRLCPPQEDHRRFQPGRDGNPLPDRIQPRRDNLEVDAPAALVWISASAFR
jgi:hypothetical protein